MIFSFFNRSLFFLNNDLAYIYQYIINLTEVLMKLLFTRPFLALFCGAFLALEPNVIFAGKEEPFLGVKNFIEQKERPKEHCTKNLVEAIGYSNDSYYLQRIHDNAYYHIVAFSDNGDVVQLHDASKWEVQRNGRQKVLQWVQADDIFIKPNASCFSFYKYVLHNRTVNQAVEVNLINPPLPMGAYTFRITNIQPYERLVLLSDNTVWQVGPSSNFSYWNVGQRVIVGVNNKWRTTSFPHILINVDMSGQPYSEADFYGYPLAN